MARCDALLVVGDDEGAQDVIAAARARALPVWHGRLKPDLTAVADLHGRQVLAFAGIGDPEKFFASVANAGIAIARRVAFADHHRFTAEEAAELIMEADERGLSLITTEKDRARMAGDPAHRDAGPTHACAAGDDGDRGGGRAATGGVGEAKTVVATPCAAPDTASAPLPARHRPPADRRSSI